MLSPVMLRIARGAAVAAVMIAFLAGPAAAISEILEKGEKRYSQWDEELIIRDFFQDREGGFFLDVGCSHPRRYSTTFYLEKHLGWSGIGIDAAEEYAARWKKFRPASKFFTYLVTDHSGTSETFYVTGHLPTSTSKKERVRGDAREVQVPTTTLDDLLEREGVEKIDFLSMDIEGAQWEALQGFDIERYRPELVCIEKDRPDVIPEWFERHGYERLRHYEKYDLSNWYFAPKDLGSRSEPAETGGQN